MQNGLTTISCQLTPELNGVLRSLALRRGTSKNSLIEYVLKRSSLIKTEAAVRGVTIPERRKPGSPIKTKTNGEAK